MSELKVFKLVILGEEDVSSAMNIEKTLDRVDLIINRASEERIVFVAPVPKIVREWLEAGQFQLVRKRYCAMTSGLGLPVTPSMDIFRTLNRIIEWAKDCRSVEKSEKQKIFLRFGERLSAELWAAALAKRRGGTVVSVVDGKDVVGSYFAVNFVP